MSSEPRKRRRAINEPGHAHFLTYSCWQRFPLLARDRSRQWVIDVMEHVRTAQNIAIWAYVIMPEHVHILIRPREKHDEIRRILAALKAPVSRKAKMFLQSTGSDWLPRLTIQHGPRETFRFWQPGGGFDGNLWVSKTIENVIDYIHANPVRRGLVARPSDWIWSSAIAHLGRSDIPLQVDRVDLT